MYSSSNRPHLALLVIYTTVWRCVRVKTRSKVKIKRKIPRLADYAVKTCEIIVSCAKGEHHDHNDRVLRSGGKGNIRGLTP